MGVIAYVVMNLFAGKKEKITPVMYILAVLFIPQVYFNVNM